MKKGPFPDQATLCPFLENVDVQLGNWKIYTLEVAPFDLNFPSYHMIAIHYRFKFSSTH
ncbi:uncharacterized protein PHALS_02473 [Plasmopara halstedii]|uniref:Uncharacterized protein n=1 Tax=Plasmopara halstedii TaxID=4781 RepID=A0A0P1AZ22_PLAHL|nr:uncharacterized protein PHALS_02473 [Plasmopara halstedii]CEG46090.1 hypothetical protein PHALS_02473 [Plasmopara halstedii]|eukprot:XP_024582459.1 hypothetical protein PHALS_02473 [Plasmopara halstedii]